MASWAQLEREVPYTQSKIALGLEKVKLKMPFVEIEWKNRDVKDVPVHIFSKHSGKCVDVQDYSHDDGRSIVQYSVHGADNQRWVFEPTGSGFYHIISVYSRKCLDGSWASLGDGVEIIQYFIHGGDNQKWFLRPVETGYYHIVNKRSGKCLAVNEASQENAAKLIQRAIHGGDNQRWRLLIAKPL